MCLKIHQNTPPEDNFTLVKSDNIHLLAINKHRRSSLFTFP
ncbi:hypothetical protein LDG_7020 [Legionella drancourtii LLAP12]|uniref:Uncharacterized protein n=1 Tax=Legionella drancourtii LLAP12 TaxID=658187 RepID=G9EP39_9GAMM|nr:hypothetical protein LDG_7020 [Legionella drancourtii LLAP12]